MSLVTELRLFGCCGRQDCDQYVASLWDWLEGLGTGIQRSDPDTWTQDRWPPTYRGILNSLEIAHQSFVWRVRKHERLRKVPLMHAGNFASHLCYGVDHLHTL